MNNTTRLQLIDSKVKGFLDIKSKTDTPINLSISDIRDISSRSGMFSKTITLSGTKNNNKILNNYFEVNVTEGTFNVNKKQKVALIQNGVVIKDNCFMRLLKVVKKQEISNIDDYVEYEVQITDGLGDFFKDISNKELKELTGWEKFSHIFNVDNIVDSFSNTVDDGYKYILPHITKGSNGESRYHIGEIMPGIYAKQIFDRIHEQNGMTYEWTKLDHKDFQFDKAIIPYSGDVKKLSEEFIEENKVEVESKTKQHTETETMVSLPSAIIVDEVIDFTDVVKDVTGKFDLVNNLYNNSLIISNPDSLVYKVNIDYDIVFVNDGQSDISPPSFNLAINSGLTLVDDNNTTLLTKYVPAEIDSNYSGVLQNHSSDETYIVITPDVPYNWTPGEHYVAKNKVTDFTLNISELNDTDKISLRIFSSRVIYGNTGLLNWGLKMKIVINNIYVEILPATQNGLLPGADVDLRKCLPNKIKQSEFLKSVYQKYNLYPLPDEDDPNHLIYVTRDEFYDSGEIRDWTDKLSKGQNQELIFLPDITTKKMILSYKDDDKDPVLTAYRDQTLETFGQVSALFDSENVKGEERKEEIFSPTISLTSDFGAVLPILAPDFKMNIRYLQDGGELGCNNYQITAGGVITNHLSYPFVSMFDKPFNPTFSIEYALSDYYAYNIGVPKKNTLYTLHWRRTLSQINEGKMLKAYFYLNEKDISLLKLNDKIKVNNTLYYINKIIDYNANDFKPTKVELLTVEDDLKLPRVGNNVIFNPSVIDLDAELAEGLTPVKPVVDGGFFNESISEVIRKRINSTTVVSRPTLLDGNMGVGNIIPEDFKGIILGDGIQVDSNGIYISENVQLTEEGLKLQGSLDLTDVTVTFPELDDKEDISNKVQDLSSPNAITYPSTNAVKNALDSKVESVTGTGVDNTDPINPIINIDKHTVGLGNVDNVQQIPLTDKGANNGVAELDSTGKVPVSQLPSYVSDVETYPTLSSFPTTGVDNLIYIAEDTNLTYRWAGSTYVEISPSIALGETSSTAYRGDRGKIAYDHSQLTSGNPHNVTKTDVGLGNVDNTSDANKPISIATQTALDGKVESVTGVNGVPVNNTDPRNPIIGLQDRLPIEDTRIDNENPQWYFNNRPYSTIYEFKHIGTLGLSSIFTSGSYCTIKTITQWDDSSGDYPYQIATNPGDGKMAKRYGINDTTWSDWEEIGPMDIVPITYTNLKTLKDNNNLQKGVRYFITDRDIWIDALDTDKLSMSAKRHFRIVKDQYYTPHTTSIGLGTQNYLGIYGQTYDRGSTPYSSSVIGGTTYYAIWGGRMWVRQNNFTGSPDIPGPSNETIQSGWTIVNESNNTYYESKIFDIKYNIDEDIIWEQSDDRGNIIKRENSTTSYIDITDWGNVNIYNNVNFGIYNNFRGSNKAIINNNTNIGRIYRNSNGGGIFRNSLNGSIYNNSNWSIINDNSNGILPLGGGIYNNSNYGGISENSNSDEINNNSNNGDISNNSNIGNIWNNSNNGDISNNSNSGRILNNSNNGGIYYNSNGGEIYGNSSSGSTSFTISYNMNNGFIRGNISTSNINIQRNTNNGNIGPSTGTTNRSSNVQDTQVNK